MNELPVTIIVTGRNSETTILPCLESLASQDWPIDEILVFDNGSTDSSPRLIAEFAARSRVPVRLMDGGPNGFICSAYNRGAKMAKSEILVLCHSDGMIPGPGELRKLVLPLVEDPSASASYPRLLMPRDVWNRFPFWQKFLFVRAVDSTAHSRCAIFDAVRKSVYMKAGGFDEKRFFANCGYGGEDNDAQVRFSRYGRQIMSEARAVHLHSFSPNYGFGNYLAFRKLLARTYGMQLRWQHGVVAPSDLLFFVRPVLAFLPLLACAFFAFGHGAGFVALGGACALNLVFALLNSRKMLTSRQTLGDVRILLIVPVSLFMTCYETWWFFRGLREGGRV